MKKAAIAGVVVALGAIWTGTAWYTGQKAEAFVKQSIEDGNAELSKFGEKWGMTPVIELMSFERGVFSSTERYRVKFTLPAKGSQPAEEHEIQFVEHLSHGPFPFSNLASGKLAPAMVASRFQIEETPAVKGWFAATKGATPLSGAYSVSYGKRVSGTFNLAPAEATSNQTKLTFSGMTGDVDFDTNTKHAILALKSDSLALAGPAGESDIVGMAVKGITLDSDLAPGKNDIAMGSQKLVFKEWAITSKTKPPVLFKDTSIGVDLAEADTGVNAKMVLDFGMINVQQKDMAGLQLAIGLKNMDPKALKALNEVYEASSRRMMQADGNEPKPEFTPEEQQILKTNVELLLAGKPSLSVSPLQVRTANGTSTFNLDVDLAKPASTDKPASDLAMEAIRKLDAKLVLSKGNLADLMAIEPQMRGVPADRAATTAKGQAEMIGTMAVAMGVAKTENDNIVSYLNYADGQVDFNGKKMPLQQFMMMVMSGAMGGMR
ncbi:Protein YdgA [Achromobacter pulmonis]|uniref:YdgA family protein n=1 Tax=Achromobacter pulmonis TaxID=1389932 RepID=UPI0014663757|nr:YdgA family protein [Achromobacter pulmonis]CAB3689480.1 Protein YdgA [Achromobacter pulmonis]